MDVDFHSPVRMGLAVLPRMIERGGGQIMFVSSMGGRIPIVNESAYNAAKYAMCGFAEAMLLDLAGTPVEVKLVLPGPIATEIWDQPDNVPALMDVEKVPGGGVRGRHRRRDRGRRVRVLHPARVPRRRSTPRPSRSARRRHCDQYLRGMADFAQGSAGAERVVNEVRDVPERDRYEIVVDGELIGLAAVQAERRAHIRSCTRRSTTRSSAADSAASSSRGVLDDIRQRGLLIVPDVPVRRPLHPTNIPSTTTSSTTTRSTRCNLPD